MSSAGSSACSSRSRAPLASLPFTLKYYNRAHADSNREARHLDTGRNASFEKIIAHVAIAAPQEAEKMRNGTARAGRNGPFRAASLTTCGRTAERGCFATA